MIKRTVFVPTIILIMVIGLGLTYAYGHSCNNTELNKDGNVAVKTDTLSVEDMATRYSSLTESDYQRVAKELDIEIAVMKAVVLVEAGKSLQGFWAPGVPVVNFDKTMYNKLHGKGSGKKSTITTIPDGLTGNYAKKEWTQLINARRKNEDRANMATFWGMFQIGGFNYKQCGCETIDEFVRLMSFSELEQLELFAAFIINTGMVQSLRIKNWSSFARKYNGAGYAKRGYHTLMARAYSKIKAEETKQNEHLDSIINNK